MKLDDLYYAQVFGDTLYRGDCPAEEIEQANFFAWLKHNYLQFYQAAIHPKNEGKRHYKQAAKDKAMGALNTGASDVIIPGSRAFVCEIKRADHTKSRLLDEQAEYLEAANNLGAFTCIALGAEGAKLAFKQYLKED